MAADDHPIVRAGLAAVIGEEPDLEFVGEAANGQEAVALYRAKQPDVVLMDLRMPVLGGVEAIRAIRSEFPSAKIIALTTYEGDTDIHRALEAGAVGYLLKEMLPTDVVDAVRSFTAASASSRRASRVVSPSTRRGSISRPASVRCSNTWLVVAATARLRGRSAVPTRRSRST
jgi:DNA-binding NarL/FixJ family response regulator